MTDSGYRVQEDGQTTVIIESRSNGSGLFVRLFATISVLVVIGSLGVWASQHGLLHVFSMAVVLTIAAVIGELFSDRQSKLRLSFGPFTKIADAIAESAEDIGDWQKRHSLQIVALIRFVEVSILSLIALGFAHLASHLYSVWLFVAFVAGITTLIASPDIGRWLLKGRTSPQDSVKVQTLDSKSVRDERVGHSQGSPIAAPTSPAPFASDSPKTSVRGHVVPDSLAHLLSEPGGNRH